MNPYLKVWLRFNDDNNIAKDECGNTWIVEQKDTTDTAPTIINADTPSGKACDFGGTQAFLTTTSPTLGTSDFTVDWWEFIPAGIDSFIGEVISIDRETRSYAFDILYNKSPSPTFSTGNGSAWSLSGQSIGSIVRNEWVHRAIVRSDDYFLTFENGIIVSRVNFGNAAINTNNLTLFVGNFYRANRPFPGALADIRIHVGIALFTESFTPPTTEDDYDSDTFPFAEKATIIRSVVKPTENLADIRRTVEATSDNFANSSSHVIRSEDTFKNVNRIVNTTADEFANAKRSVEVSTVNEFVPIKRTVNVADNFASVKRSNICSEQNFSPIKRSVLSSQEYALQTQRRLLNFADELASLQRSVHEPQVVDIYTRRRLINKIETLADTRRQAQLTADNFAASNRQVLCSEDSFSPTKRTVDKTLDTFSNTKRQVLFSADNEFEPICYVLNDSDNIAYVTSRLVFSDIYFAPIAREAMRTEEYSIPVPSQIWKSEENYLPVNVEVILEDELDAPVCLAVVKSSDNFADTLRQITIQSIFVSVKTQGGVIDTIVFHQSKQSSIGHLCTRFRGITFYAGLVNLSSALASNIHIAKNGTIYAVMKE